MHYNYYNFTTKHVFLTEFQPNTYGFTFTSYLMFLLLLLLLLLPMIEMNGWTDVKDIFSDDDEKTIRVRVSGGHINSVDTCGHEIESDDNDIINVIIIYVYI